MVQRRYLTTMVPDSCESNQALRRILNIYLEQAELVLIN